MVQALQPASSVLEIPQSIEYHILLSPAYQVPVLYLVLKGFPGLMSIDVVYQLLVPEAYKAQVRNVGIIGAVSYGVSIHLFAVIQIL